MPPPASPLYLFYGTQVDAILRARDSTLDRLLDRESRYENLTEFVPTGRKSTVELAEILPEIASDLTTSSFLPGAAKVVVVTNPAELYGASATRKPPARKKKAPARSKRAAPPNSTDEGQARDPFDWFERELPRTGNHVILLAFEDESAGREVNEKGELLQRISRLGVSQRFRERNKAFFRIEDAILQRNAAECISVSRLLWGSGKGEQSVYASVVRSLRFMIQTAIARDRRVGDDAEARALFFPQRAQFSILRQADFVRGKHLNSPPAYRTTALIAAYERLLDVYRAQRPRPGELFVPDSQLLFERAMMELFASPPPPRR
jgi:hypothetical protein